MGTPLGAIYTTNITPDRETGIGNYSLAEFDRAVRQGIAKGSRRLYPAMPYPSYAKLTDHDVRALYEFFMTKVPAVHQINQPDKIPELLSFRWPLAIWSFLFTENGSYVQRTDRDADWNRGAYLVQGLGHCGACHTPRGLAWQEKALTDRSARYLSGAGLDGWVAANLRGNLQTGIGAWSRADIVEFLKYGYNHEGSAFGSMTDVINNSTSYLSEDDLDAIGIYLKSLPPNAAEPAYVYNNKTAKALRSGHADEAGAILYVTACGVCHGSDGKGFTPYIPPLAGNPTVLGNDPSSLINIVLNGSAPLLAEGTPDAYRMPQFRIEFTDQQIADILSFMRMGWGNRALPVRAAQVEELRKTTDPTNDFVVILKMR